MRRGLLACALLVASCGPAALPPPSRPPPVGAEKTEVAVGVALSELLLGGYLPYGDARLAHYVQSVGERVARQSERPALPWRFIVTEDPDIGAQTLPGGRISISKNLLAYLDDEAELAAVLAHEIAHAARKHGNKVWDAPLPAGTGVEAAERDQRLEEDEERQADALAARYLRAAGYEPRAVVSALDALERAALRECARAHEPAACKRDEDDRSDPHPKMAARLARAAIASGSGGGERGREPYLAALEGLAFGDASDTPTLSGRRFGAAGSLSFELPPGMSAEAHAGVLVGSSEPKLTLLRLRGELWPRVLESALESQPFSAQSLAGIRALVGDFGHDSPLSVALVRAPEGVYLVVVEGNGSASRALLDGLLGSVRREPASSKHLPRIHVVRAKGRQSLRELVRAHCPDTSLELASALNRLPADADVRPGATLKCVSAR